MAALLTERLPRVVADGIPAAGDPLAASVAHQPFQGVRVEPVTRGVCGAEDAVGSEEVKIHRPTMTVGRVGREACPRPCGRPRSDAEGCGRSTCARSRRGGAGIRALTNCERARSL
ncbi:hypothetical protein GCM10027039_42130 [Terrabacter koreensis]